MSKLKALIVGWDGATWSYIDPLLAAGRLPNLQNLLEAGARATLTSTIPPFTNVAWPSLVTGMSPANTGVFDGVRLHPDGERIVPTNLVGYRGTPIWKWVGRYGWRSTVLNVPMTFPAEKLDGYMVTGFDSPVQSPRICYPGDLLAQWQRKGHSYDVLTEEIRLMAAQNPQQSRGSLKAFVEDWVRLTRDQGEHAAWLIANEPTELMFVVFSGTDSINHRTRDFGHISAVYEAADQALGTILAACDGEPLVCLLSDHGSTPADRYISLYRALTDLGVLSFKRQIAARFWKRVPGPGSLGKLILAMWRRLPLSLRRLLSTPLLVADPRLAVANDNIDWSRTSAYAFTGMGAIYINRKKGNQSRPISEAEAGRLCEELRSALENLEDDSGKRLFARVHSGVEVYAQADRSDNPPELVLEPASWKDHMITGYPTDPLVRDIEIEREYGTHTPHGILVLKGNNVRRGLQGIEASIVDVIPTLLALVQLPIAANTDGEVLRILLENTPQTAFTEPISEEDEPSWDNDFGTEAIMQRLIDLGYME